MAQNATQTQYDEETEELIALFDEGGLSRREAEAYVLRSVQGKTRKRTAEILGVQRGTFDTLYRKANAKIGAMLAALEEADRWGESASDLEPFETVEDFKEACFDHGEVGDRMVETIDWELVQTTVDQDDEFLADAKRALAGDRPYSGDAEENVYRLLMSWNVAPDQ